MGNDNLYKVDKGSIALTIWGEFVIKYDFKLFKTDKYALLLVN